MEVASTDEVARTTGRLRDEGLETATEDNVSCCYAVQDKVWVDDPDGAPWEVYTVLTNTDEPQQSEVRTEGPGSSCSCGIGAA